MARIRTIKPDLYRHELLQELEEKHPELRPMLVFTGLMTQADREGRFRWNPRILELDILPFVTFDLSCSMSLLAEHGFLLRYEAQEVPTGSFRHGRSTRSSTTRSEFSELPAPPQERDVDVTGTRAARVEHATSTPLNPSRGEGEEEGEVGKGTTRGDTPSKTDLSLFSRILCEKTGIFGTRDQAEVHDCFRVFVQKSGMSLGDAVNHMAGRWGGIPGNGHRNWRGPMAARTSSSQRDSGISRKFGLGGQMATVAESMAQSAKLSQSWLVERLGILARKRTAKPEGKTLASYRRRSPASVRRPCGAPAKGSRPRKSARAIAVAGERSRLHGTLPALRTAIEYGMDPRAVRVAPQL